MMKYLFSSLLILTTLFCSAQGIVKKYHSNGKLWYTGKENSDGEEIGVWKEYYKNGVLMELITYNNKGDERHGLYKYYYNNGKLEEEGKYKKGEKVGEWKEYYEDGVVRNVGEYKKGEKIGEWKEYYESGKIEQIREYKKNGKSLKYYKNGLLEYKSEFINGENVEAFYTIKGELLPSHMRILYLSDGEYVLFDRSVLINGKKIKSYVNRQGKPTRYFSNDIIKVEYILEKDHSIRKTYYKTGKLKSVSTHQYSFRYTKEDEIQIAGDKIGVTKEYNQEGKLVKEIDEYYKNGLASYNDKAYKTALKRLQICIDKNTPNRAGAEHLMANIYKKGLGGVFIDKEKAKQLYLSSGKGNMTYSYFSLAKMILTEEKSLLEKITNTDQIKNLEDNPDYKRLIEVRKEAFKYFTKYINNHETISYLPTLKTVVPVYNFFEIDDDYSNRLRNSFKDKVKNEKQVRTIGDSYLSQSIDAFKNKEFTKAFNLAKKSALEQNRIGMFNLGYFYTNGIGTDKDLIKSLFWYKESSDLGYLDASLNYAGLIFQANKSIIDKINSLGTTEEENKEYEKLNSELNKSRLKASKYLERIVKEKESSSDLNVLATLVNIYDLLKTDTQISKRVRKYYNLKK